MKLAVLCLKLCQGDELVVLVVLKHKYAMHPRMAQIGLQGAGWKTHLSSINSSRLNMLHLARIVVLKLFRTDS